MSQFLGAADPTLGFIAAKDMRLHAPGHNEYRHLARVPVIRDQGYRTTFWPRGGGLMGDMAADYSMMEAVSWSFEIERVAQGAASRVGFNGTARDQYGAPLAGVTCSLFRTSDKQWIQDFTSRADGTFTLVSWYSPDTHFICFYKAGSPNVFGTTDQNLVGS